MFSQFSCEYLSFLWQSKAHLLPLDLQLHFLLAHLVAQALGHEDVLRFVKNSFVPSLANENKPLVSFEAKLTKVKAPTLDKLFDVETSTAMQDIKLIKVNCHVLQRFVMAYQACRPVNLVKAAKLEVVSFPISIFNTDRSMRQSQEVSAS